MNNLSRRAKTWFVSIAAVTTIGLLICGCAAAPKAELATSVDRAPLQIAEPIELPGAGPACPTAHCVSVAVSGDLLFHPSLWNQYASQEIAGQNFNFVPLLEGQRAYLEQSDLAVCQMETPLAPVGGPYSGYPIFSIPPEVAIAAADVGYDVCTTASNHSVDQGTEGLLRTLDVLEAAGLEHTGMYRAEGERDIPFITEANGVNIAIINDTFSLNGLRAEHPWQVDYPLDANRAIAKAQAARAAGAEIVISGAHVGTEYSTRPNSQQTEYAHALADSGEFDFIYQHHSHSIQPVEQRNGAWILYSLGNTISESAPAERRVNNEFLMARVQFAQQADGSWLSNRLDWNVATNKQHGKYAWCSVMPDAPQGICQSAAFDGDVLARSTDTIQAMGAAEAGATAWNIVSETEQATALAAERKASAYAAAQQRARSVRLLWNNDEDARIWNGSEYVAPDLSAFNAES